MSRFGGRFGSRSSQPAATHFGGGGDSYEPSDLAGGDVGGGFQGTQDTAASPGRDKKHSGAIVQTLTPVTVRQLHLAHHSHPDDVFKVDDRELNQITLVGQIMKLQVQSTNVELEVDDGTGKIGVRMWLDVEDEMGGSRKWDVGSYVRVIGNLRSFMDTRSVLAFRVLPIEKFDEVTYHFLDVINVHLAVTKGELGGGASVGTTSSVPSGHAAGGAQYRAGGAVRPAAPAGHPSFEQTAVMEVIRAACRHSGGCSLEEVLEALSAQISEDVIRETIDWLRNEGYLYNTTSDNIFACAE